MINDFWSTIQQFVRWINDLRIVNEIVNDSKEQNRWLSFNLINESLIWLTFSQLINDLINESLIWLTI